MIVLAHAGRADSNPAAALDKGPEGRSEGLSGMTKLVETQGEFDI
jgi:hypothetical protein